jgi:molybdopterin/thiamine biosynthesis adenylyltransferase
MSLSEAQIDRYSRQIILPEVGGRGQQRLLDASVLLLDSAEPVAGAASYLVGAGVGRIRILAADGETADKLAADLRAANHDVDVRATNHIDTADNLIVAGTAVPAGLRRTGAGETALVAGGFRGANAWVTRKATFPATCPACLAGEEGDPRDPEGDELEAVAIGAVAAMMAVAALNVLLGVDDQSEPALVRFDARTASSSTSRLMPGTNCPACAGESSSSG